MKRSVLWAVQWLGRLAVVMTLGGAVLVAVGYQLGPERAWFLALAQYVPYPAYLLPALVVVGLSFTLSWGWRVAALLGLSLVVTVIMGLELHTGDAGDGRVRMMTYNVKAYRAALLLDGMQRIGWEVALHDPDILVMQDAGELAAVRETNPAAIRMFSGRQVYASGQYIVASRFPMQECGIGLLPAKEHHLSYVHCIVNVKGAKLDLFTVHFLTPREGLNAARHEKLQGVGEWEQNVAMRMTQAQGLARAVQASKHPVIIGGDLNAPEHSLVVRALLNTGVRDAFSAAGVGYGYTHGHSLRPGISFLRIDHILVDPLLGVADCFAGGKEGSEHRPVIADLLLNRE
ncbi:MAG: endonuclease/exonuclease/phosphatase family protein [Burkholderiales bacterium]|nr:endonuclease/exonuclease/phosphatase family protein [Burkholderiales bacterium]